MTISITISKRILIGMTALGLVAFSSHYLKTAFAHGGDTNLIHACVNDSNGAMRRIGANASCGSGESNLHWNKKGSPGLGGLVDDLAGAQLNEADFRYKNLNGRDLSGATLVGASFIGAKLVNTNLSNLSASGVSFEGADLTNASLQNSSFSSANLNGILNGVVATNAIFGNASLAGSAVGANFSNSSFTNASVATIDLTDASLQGATDFPSGSAAVWNNTTCPDGTNSDNNGNTCEGHLAP